MPTASPRAISRPRAFTLTEIMIALALVALLLVGISRIFAITSTTISSGQALAKAMRSQKAIQTSLSGDFFGVGDIGNPAFQNGMMPLVNTADKDYAAPFLTISNFRVAAYKNQEDLAGDTVQPADPGTTMDEPKFRQRSIDIRGVDLNKNGSEADAGELIPIYSYGERNFRIDTIGFFTRGAYESQTGSDGSFVDPARSLTAFVWYGHLRTFNSTGSQLDITNGYGAPGSWLTPNSGAGATPGQLPNRNNRFADQFILGRVQNLLIEPIVPDGSIPTGANYNTRNDNTVARHSVCIGNDPTKPVMFIRRSWADPTYVEEGATPAARPSMGPIALTANVYKYWNGQNRTVRSDDRLTGGTPAPNGSAVILGASSLRTDVVGVGPREYRQRARFSGNYDASTPLAAPGQSYWWESLPINWTNRYWVNPYARASQFADPSDPDAMRAINPKSLAQRSQILSESTSQFIVEYAGDFVGQNADGSLRGGTYLADGTPQGTTPDGVIDFVVIGTGPNAIRQTKWYGMPRDVDGDGVIAATGSERFESADVIPLADFADTRQTAAAKGAAKGLLSDEQYEAQLGPSQYTFERRLPPLPTSGTPRNYASLTDEPTGSSDPTGTAYQCVWGPREFEREYTRTVNGQTVTARPVPQLIRIIADIRDPNGKLKDAVTQEFIFPVRVTAAIEPPKTP